MTLRNPGEHSRLASRLGSSDPIGRVVEMKKLHLSIVTALVTAVILISAACSSSVSSVKQLDESSARDLIRDRLKEPYKIRADNVSKLLGRTLKDYKSSNAGNPQEATVKRLLDKGLVIQTVETVSYPKISGTFVSQKNYYGDWTVYDLEMRPNSNLLTGDSYRTGTLGSPKPQSPWWVEGSIEPDGRLRLNTSGANEEATYVEEGSAAYIDFKGGSTYGRYKGNATGKKVDASLYTYSWNPDLSQKRLIREGNAIYVIGGECEVGNVSGLRLVTDTVATATFGWKATLNDVGASFFPVQPPTGTGEVSFGKKPDGTWFVDELRLGD